MVKPRPAFDRRSDIDPSILPDYGCLAQRIGSHCQYHDYLIRILRTGWTFVRVSSTGAAIALMYHLFVLDGGEHQVGDKVDEKERARSSFRRHPVIRRMRHRFFVRAMCASRFDVRSAARFPFSSPAVPDQTGGYTQMGEETLPDLDVRLL